jgi:hypothetical protein
MARAAARKLLSGVVADASEEQPSELPSLLVKRSSVAAPAT